MDDGHSRRPLLLGTFFERGLPSRIKKLSKVNQRQSLRRASSASEVEDNVRLHGREKGVPGAGCTIVEEVGLVNTTILGLGSSLADDTE